MQTSTLPPLNEESDTVQALFGALSGNFVLIKADAPRFTILAATPNYLQQTGHSLETLIGKGVFEAFPENEAAPDNTGPSDIRASYEKVLQEKKAHYLPVQRYDLQNENGSFSKHYWRISNSPVLNQDGEVAYIINKAEDITYELRSQEQAEKMKGMEQAHRLFMQAPFAIHIFSGPDLIVELANPPTLELWGRTGDVMGMRFVDIFPELRGHGYDKLMQEVIQTGKTRFFYEVPLILNRPGRAPKGYFNFIYQPYYKNEEARAEGVLIIAHEVTEQVMARQEASHSEQSLSLAVEIAKLGVYDIDLTTGIATCSQQVMDWFGLNSPSHLVKEIIARIYPEDQPRANEALERSVAGEDEGRHDFVYRVLHPQTGAFQYLRSIGKVLFEEGKPLRLSGIIQDETEQILSHKRIEESQRELLALFAEAPVAIATVDASDDLVMQSANTYCARLVGRLPKDMLGKPLLQAIPELKGQGLDELLQQAIRSGRAFRADEMPVHLQRAGKQETIYINLTYQLRRDGRSKITGVLIVATDVTQQVLTRQKIEDLVAKRTRELAEANQSLKLINAELQRSNANLEEFAHAASHDLKEPIRKITFFTHQLKDQLGDQLQEHELRSFGRIQNATERMGNLIDDLLLYSHVSQRPHEMESVDLNEKVQRVLEDLELDVQEKAAVIKVGKLPRVKGYRRQLQQLLQNLISNALKYSKADVPPLISITADQTERNGRAYHVIQVEDNGIGFEEEYSEKIFQMFARLHGKSEYGGTGVGLSIVKKVVENHHGHIQVESVLGQGSRFRVLLPVE